MVSDARFSKFNREERKDRKEKALKPGVSGVLAVLKIAIRLSPTAWVRIENPARRVRWLAGRGVHPTHAALRPRRSSGWIFFHRL
jgi:hypothetical protein